MKILGPILPLLLTFWCPQAFAVNWASQMRLGVRYNQGLRFPSGTAVGYAKDLNFSVHLDPFERIPLSLGGGVSSVEYPNLSGDLSDYSGIEWTTLIRLRSPRVILKTVPHIQYERKVSGGYQLYHQGGTNFYESYLEKSLIGLSFGLLPHASAVFEYAWIRERLFSNVIQQSYFNTKGYYLGFEIII